MLFQSSASFNVIFRRYLFILVCLLSIVGCKNEGSQKSSEDDSDVTSEEAGKEIDVKKIANIDLNAIKERGYLTAIMDFSSTGLFIYRGRHMGYEYELLSMFAETLGVELRFVITPDMDEAFRKLNKGEGDIVAFNLTVTKDRKKRIAFTDYHNIVRQVLVQRKPDNWRKMKLHEIERKLIRTPIELAGKQVLVRKSSAYAPRLKNLAEEIGEDIYVIEAEPELETESIINMVARGEINYTVADEDIAIVNSRYHPNLDIKTPVSLPQQIAWGVRKNADSLRWQLNTWIYNMKKTPVYNTIYRKYFSSSKQSRRRKKSELFSATKDRISPYDDLIKEAAKEVGWNWRLLAAQISQESQFDPDAKSWAGALGLMQVMPRTGRAYGVNKLRDPKENISAGVEHLKWLQGIWKDAIADSVERQKFILASYNAGQGHVQDAQRLAEKYGGNPQLWEGNVEKYLILKSDPRYYKDKVVKYGYCRGQEPSTYVKEILKLYQQYQHLVKA